MSITKNGISIIIPVFNGAPFIRSAYECILNQELSDFEILFIENNSTDNSADEVKVLQGKDERVFFLKETRQGAAAARNKGIEHARGGYIYFFDVDDQLFYGAIQSLKQVLDAHVKIESVFGNTRRTSARLTDLNVSVENTNRVEEKRYLGLHWLVYKDKLPNVASFLHRKSVFDKIDGFLEDLYLGEDAFFHMRLGNEVNIAFLDRDILSYYRHKSSTVSRENRRVTHKVFTYWKQFVKAYIPYCNSENCSKELRIEIYRQTYWSIGKMIVLTPTTGKRKLLKEGLLKEIPTMKIPWWIGEVMNLLVLTGNNTLFKVYVYYLVNPYFKYIFKESKG